MFDTIKKFLGRWKKKMIPYEKIKEMTGEEIPFYTEMEKNTQLWYNMYINQPYWSLKKENRNIISIGLPSAITRELAKPAVIEAVITAKGGQKADFIQKQIDNMFKELRHNLEKGLAFGNMIYRPYVYRNNQIGIACHFFDSFFPVAFDERGILTQVVFLQKIKSQNKWYVVLEYHKLGNNIYYIQSKAFLSDEYGLIGKEVPLNNIEGWKNVSNSIVIGGIEKPLFGFFKTPFGNNIDSCSNMGVSVYSSAVELIRQADEQWEALQWEFKSGERKLFVSPEAFQLPLQNQQMRNKLEFDRLYQKLGIEEKESFFYEFSPELRESNFYNGLQSIYKMIEFNTGLSYGILSDPQTVAMTATEIESSKQRMYATVYDIQNALEDMIKDLVYAISTLADLYQLTPNDEYEILFDWGDGIIKDTQAQQEELEHMRLDVAAGLLKPELYIMKKYKVDEQTAKNMMAEQNEVTEVY